MNKNNDSNDNNEKKTDEEKITFQIIDWDFFHDEDDDGNKKFAIRLFGRDKQQQSVYFQVDDFKPYFYVELQDDWRISTVDTILEEVKKKVSKDHTESLIKFNIEEKYKFWGFTNYKKFKYAKLTFDSFDGMKAYARALSKAYKIPSISRRWIRLKLYESNILPVLRFMHIRQLEAVGWVSIDKSKTEEFDSPPTCCKLNYKTKWQNVQKIDDRSINKFIIASFDIECKSEDGSFPQPQRENDRIIQIGITLSKYGETECYERHLLSLKNTAEIEGTHVQSFNTEEELLLGFTKTLRTIDPDVITGYNIFGFDFMYMMERAKKLGITHRFERLSRVNGEQAQWVDQTLTSAALGTNLMKYYKITGRVLVDLMKVAQRDFKLSSYKLDYVSSYFIREAILNIINIDGNKFKIITKSTYGVNVGQYITISYDDGSVESKYNEGEKFQILEVGKDFLIVEGNVDTSEFMGKGFKISWCQAKDDVSPQDIFKLADGSPTDRAKIGKYCIMDCELVSKLMAKLQILTNSVSMANVCNVPLSYLFLRGQGVKIFSLVAKKCREKDHLIPVIQKKEKKKDWSKQNGQNGKTDVAEEAEKRMEKMLEKLIYQLNNKHKEEEEIDDEEELSYEGAIVFPPKPGVYFEPIPVLDYASLYPSSMIFRNLSHECFVNDPKYDNLPGYRYHVISYRVMTKEDMEMTAKEKKEREKMVDKKEEWITCRFAEKLDGTKGIIPEILQDLLSARKKFKKLMEAEKDPFMKSILDGLQLAYKVTANSLYGQTGASTSPICMKEIAASTTATGREMLQFSKYFIENTFAEIIELALNDKIKYFERMKQIYKYFPTNISYPDVNRATGKITTVNLHVCTDDKYIIPDDKFIVKSIEYDEDCQFNQNLKSAFLNIKKKVKTTIFPEKEDNVTEFIKAIYNLSPEHKTDFIEAVKHSVMEKEGSCKGLYSTYSKIWNCLEITSSSVLKSNLLLPLSLTNDDTKKEIINSLFTIIEFRNYFDNFKETDKTLFNKIYSHVLEKGKPQDDIEFSGEFKGQLFLLKVEERSTLFAIINKYILNKKGNTGDIYDKYKNFWNNLDFTDSDFLKKKFLKPLQEMSYESRQIFVDNLETTIRDLGYNGRDEMFVKFYDFVNSTIKGYTTKPEVIYGDTDSVFFRMGFTDKKTGEKIKDKKSLIMAIKIGIWASTLITTLLPKPQAQAYEKVLYPFIIQGKKRYVANLFEKDPEKFKQKSMGIELKRRDNANIVKVMCAGIIDEILNKHSAEGAYEFARNTLHKIITGKFKMDKFIITKTLKGNSLTKQERKIEELKPKEERTYADRTRIVHAVLADRMADRDPGNRPLSNDRIPYAYVEPKGKVTLQGDRVETPEYILENKLKLDYLFYITNQIKTPALKFLDLLIENAEAIFREFEIKEENRKHCMMPISYYADDENNEDSHQKQNNETNDFDEFDEFEIDNDSETDPKTDEKYNSESDSDNEKPKNKIKEKYNKQNKQNKNKEFVSFDKLESNLESEFVDFKKKNKNKNNNNNNNSNNNNKSNKKYDKLTNNKIITYGDLLDNMNENDFEKIPEKLKNKNKSAKNTKSKNTKPVNRCESNIFSTHDLIDELT